METILVALCGAAAALFIARHIKKSISKGEECSDCCSEETGCSDGK